MTNTPIHELERQIKDVFKKLEVYKKKLQRFGVLDEDEKLRERDLLVEFYLIRDEIVDTKMEKYLFSYLYTDESDQYLSNIRKFIPWDGTKIIRHKEFSEVTNALAKLNDKQLEYVEKNLKDLHECMVLNFQDFCREDDNYDHVIDLGPLITGNKLANILDVLKYVDDRYRIFGEVIGIEIHDVEVNWED